MSEEAGNPDFGVLETAPATQENTSASPAATEAVTTESSKTEPEKPAAQPEAKPSETTSGLEAYLALADQGITADTALQSVQALNLISDYFKTKPEQLLAEFKKSDPVAYRKFLDKAGDDLLAMYESEFPELTSELKTAEPGAKGTPESKGEDPRLSSLEREVRTLREDREREQQTTLANQRWNQAQDDLKKHVANTASQMKLNEDQEARLLLETERDILNDPIALKRIAQGVRVDIPRKLSKVAETLSARIKDRVQKQEAEREKVKANAKPTVPEGPQITTAVSQTPSHPLADWDEEVAAFASDLKKASAPAR